MAIVLLEDPTGKIEVTLFPRTYADAVGFLEEPDAVLVIGGALDMRGGQLQVRADAVKRASLATMITKAKAEGFYDDEEAHSGFRARPIAALDEEVMEVVDEEGNIVAGEIQTVAEGETGTTGEFLGPIGKWLLKGMNVAEPLSTLGLSEQPQTPTSPTQKMESDPTRIQVQTIILPALAPKKLLLDLKQTLEAFPGKERIQLKIGQQIIPLPMTVNMSTILESKIEKLLDEYAVHE